MINIRTERVSVFDNQLQKYLFAYATFVTKGNSKRVLKRIDIPVETMGLLINKALKK